MPDHCALSGKETELQCNREPVLNHQATLLALSCEYWALNASLSMEADFEL